MRWLRRLLAGIGTRLVPAIIVATGISLAVAGIVTYDATAGILATPAPTATPLVAATPTRLPTIPEGTPAPTSPPTGVASRIVIPAMKIDLPVVAAPPPDVFPYCNVAMYLRLSQPGQRGTTWIFAHARTGMFLPVLEASLVSNGRSMLGTLVELYTTDNRLYLYEVDLVKRHATDTSIAELPPGVFQQLIVQTSEGNRYHKPKLQVRARFLYSQAADPKEANPVPHIVVCY